MPVCTVCTHSVPYLYTVYESAFNLRLEQCPACLAFADPYVEHDELTLILDLILLKRDVFRHLLFNRGTAPRKAVSGRERNTHTRQHGQESPKNNDLPRATTHENAMTCDSHLESARQWLIYRLGSALILVDAIIRWAHLHPEKPIVSTDLDHWTTDSCMTFARTLIGCFIETVAFHLGIVAACYVVMKCVDKWRIMRYPDTEVSGVRQQFRLLHVPLALLYSSLTKLFLLLLLSVWRPVTGSRSTGGHLASAIPVYQWSSSLDHPIIISALEIFDEDKLDRDWVIRNVLGGMAVGFGLRVVLDCHPLFTTLIIIFGWIVKTAVATLVSGWVGGDVETGAAWLAYSIP